jgi:hypothetical protein
MSFWRDDLSRRAPLPLTRAKKERQDRWIDRESSFSAEDRDQC